MDEKYLNDPIVSLMKSMGFSDEYIMANVKIEKQQQETMNPKPKRKRISISWKRKPLRTKKR